MAVLDIFLTLRGSKTKKNNGKQERRPTRVGQERPHLKI
jgi:hypothetical protein